MRKCRSGKRLAFQLKLQHLISNLLEVICEEDRGMSLKITGISCEVFARRLGKNI